LVLYSGSFKEIVDIPLETIPVEAFLQSQKQIVFRSPLGLFVYGIDGTLVRKLGGKEIGGDPGTVAPLKPGWVATTSGGTLFAYATDGHSMAVVDRLSWIFDLRALPGNALLVSTDREIRIYDGWPLKLRSKAILPEDVTAVEPVGQNTLLVAATPNARWYGFPQRKFGYARLYVYGLPDLHLRASQSLSEIGRVLGMREIGNFVAVGIDRCTDEKPNIVRFLNPDFSQSNRADLTIEGLTTIVAVNDHLVTAEKPCAMSENGSLQDYNIKTGRLRPIVNGPQYILQLDGS
jgi:hypothetical protein